MSIKQDIRERKAEYTALALLIILAVGFQTYHISGWQQLPSPIYGGDFYYQMGVIEGIRQTGNPLGGSALPGSPPAYLPLYGTLVALFGTVLGLSTLKAMLYFSPVIATASIALHYILGRHLFTGAFALLVPVIAIFQFQVTLKYSPFTHAVMFPLCLIFMYRLFFVNYNWKNSLYCGIAIGLTGLSHSTYFVEIVLIFAGFVLYKAITEKAWKTGAARLAAMTAITAGTTIAIAMAYWYSPIFVFGGTSPYYTQWNSRDLSSLGNQLEYLIKGFLINDIFVFSNPLSTITTLAGLFGIFATIFLKDKDSRVRFITILFIAYIAVKNHYLITEPLLGLNFSPEHMPNIALPVLAVLGLEIAGKWALKSRWPYGAYGALALIVIMQFSLAYETRESGWYKNAGQELPEHFRKMQAHVLATTGARDVFLTTNELGFALHALTGRMLVTGRRAHNGAFMDLDRNNIDAAIILYGNDSAKRTELINKYNVRYLYWDYYWMQSEFHFSDKGELLGWFDPLLAIYSQEYEQELNQYNVSFIKQHTWIDPALREEKYRKLDALIISPMNYRSAEVPWSDDLHERLTEVWNHSYNGQKIAILYSVHKPFIQPSSILTK